ncbi:MAG: pentapeptide repeat-containing protein [Pseudomonadota bacterium]|nr:pentapeptide repeat-containing protein [Pseudomonadota bacterium]
MTESFSKAAEQLGNDKLEVRLGGIYTMERISKESPSDYWPVMETLTAFVRERARWKEEEQSVEDDVRTDGLRYPETVLPEIPTDIAAVVSVIVRRDKASIEREAQMGWRFNLQGTDLRGANFLNADLRNASFRGAHLQHAFFARANLERATFSQALLENANFFEAKLENVSFNRAKLQDATFDKANLTRAVFQLANLQGVSFMDAHLEQTHFVRAILINAYFTGAYVAAAEFGKAHLGGADLSGASGLQKEQLLLAQGDDKTRVPEGIDPPENQLWAF